MLKVHKMRLIEYEYAWGEPTADGVYCQGVFRAVPRSGLRGGGVDPAVELKDMQDKFKDGTVWRMTNVALADEISEYIDSPLKKRTDLRKTKCAGILQGSVEMAPEDELESILALGAHADGRPHSAHRRHEPDAPRNDGLRPEGHCGRDVRRRFQTGGQEEQVKAQMRFSPRPLQTVLRRSQACGTCMRRAQLWLCMD